MLALPDAGMYRSVKKNNIRFDILCDWLEGSILFDETVDEFSAIDVVDVLIDENVCKEQDFAMEIVNNAWFELERRLNWIAPGMPFSISNSRASRIHSWQEAPAHSFCVLLSLAQCYKGWAKSISGSDYGEQGELFELLAQESFKNQFSDWQVERTGWSPTQSMSLSEVVDWVADCLGETTKDNLDELVNSKDKDAGLDILCYLPFPDNRGGFPVYLMQCASGQHWKTKVNQPIIKKWQRRFIDFVDCPRKAFAIPFALSNEDFRDYYDYAEGLILDRYRLLAAARYCQDWVSSSLKDRIIEWATPRVDQLPRN